MKETKRTRVVILDTFAIIYRAYHALPDFSTSKGEPTGALFGVSSMLMSIITDLKPDYILAAYDLPGGSFRNNVEETYKANRTEAHDDLVAQIGRVRTLLQAFSIPIFEKEGYEADDILGTVSEILKKDPEMEVIIASGDMDTLQLVDGEKVKVFTIRKGIKDTVLYNEKAVVERFSFKPELLPDYKGLRGDPSDNIIGIKGIGEKGAGDLISNFGSLETIYKKLKKDQEPFLKAGIKPRILSLLLEGEEEALYSKSLATIVRDVPLSFHLPPKPWREAVQPESILTMFRELEFRALITRAEQFFSIHNVSQTEEEVVDKELLRKAGIMLWILDSDKTNASLEDILAFTKESEFKKAFQVLESRIQADIKLSQVFSEIEEPLLPIVMEMEGAGIQVNKSFLDDLSLKYHKELELLEQKIFKVAGKEFNVRSPQQLSDILFTDLGLSTKGVKKGATGGFSTNVTVLEKLEGEHEIIQLILEHRELSKLLSTYIDTLPKLIGEDGRIHAEFIQNGTTTGRFSGNNPNLQNIPTRSDLGRAIRGAFVAKQGYVLAGFDYSQIELRLTAILSKDPFMIQTFKEGKDIHSAVASRVFGVDEQNVTSEMRRSAKIINFGIIYGMGISALQKQLGTSRAEAQEFYDNYFKEFGEVRAYLESTKDFARKHGYTETMFGRRRNFDAINSKIPFIRAMAERMATNAPIQGTGADIVKLAMIHADRYIKDKKLSDKVHLLLQVHDELIYEVEEGVLKEVAPEIEKIMEAVFVDSFLKFSSEVPLAVDIKSGLSWFELK
jgi:DNA polymerase-1